jgi:DNA-binding helix-hairpin-helix protein with protein kinase domain
MAFRQVHLERQNRTVALAAQIGAGGQGTVSKFVSLPNFVAKLHDAKHQTDDMRAKANALIGLKPKDPRIVFPTDIVLDAPKGQYLGILLPFIPGVSAFSLFNPVARRKRGIQLSIRDLVSITREHASIVAAAHKRKITIGDLNESNFLTGSSGTRLIDIDSAGFSSRVDGVLASFPAEGTKPLYTAPELDATHPHDELTDRHALAVLLWQFLKGGSHPYDFTVKGTVTCGMRTKVVDGLWPFDPVGAMPPDFNAVDDGILYGALPKALQDLFHRAFHDSYGETKLRPTAAEFEAALTDYVTTLAQHTTPIQNPYLRHLAYASIAAAGVGTLVAGASFLRSVRIAIAIDSAPQKLPVPPSLSRPGDHPHWNGAPQSLKDLLNEK